MNEYVDHGISDAKGRDKRPQYDAMLNSAMKKEADLVMFWRSDRASRYLSHLVKMMNDRHAKNVSMYFHQQNIGSRTPSGRAMLQMAGVIQTRMLDKILSDTIFFDRYFIAFP
ncbi:recombinase family protein [Thalassospira sp. MA62]|nr:recombinase family protein [Thalassospira sp. MA62]